MPKLLRAHAPDPAVFILSVIGDADHVQCPVDMNEEGQHRKYVLRGNALSLALVGQTKQRRRGGRRNSKKSWIRFRRELDGIVTVLCGRRCS